MAWSRVEAAPAKHMQTNSHFSLSELIVSSLARFCIHFSKIASITLHR